MNADLRNQDLVLFPIHHPAVRPRGQWSLVSAWTKRRDIRSFGSLGNPRLEEAGESPAAEQWRIEGTSPDMPHQTVGVSCRVYVCVFAEKLSRVGHVEDHPIDVTRSKGDCGVAPDATFRFGEFHRH